MASLLRMSLRAPRARLFTPVAYSVPRRFASDYGSKQSGHEEASQSQKPRRDLEHPGPETPASQGDSSSTSKSTPSSSSGSGSSSESASNGAKPTLQTPESSKEKEDPDVKKHNEEMAQRSERTPNQLSEEDNKVDKKFWKGDVGESQTKN